MNNNINILQLQGEMWLSINNYEGLYEVSNLGRVKSLQKLSIDGKRLPEKILSTYNVGSEGYAGVKLYKDGKKKSFRVHRLVAEAFLDNKDNLPMVNHKDENKVNNNISNLEWCDNSYNCTYGDNIHRRSSKLNKTVEQCDMYGNVLLTYKSLKDCCKSGYSETSVSKCCNGKLDKYKGFTWRYTN